MEASQASAASFGPKPLAWERMFELSPQVETFEPRSTEASDEVRERFTEFVAGTFFRSLLAAMRKTVGKETIIHGGRAEEIFRSQLDSTLASRMATSRGSSFSDELYQQFVLQLGGPTNVPAPMEGMTDAYRSESSTTAGRLADSTL